MGIDIAEGETQDKYPEVTLAFSALDSEIKSDQQKVVDQALVLIPNIETKLVEAFEQVSDDKKYLDLGITTPYEVDLSFKLKGQNVPFIENVSSKERILSWSDVKNHGLEIIKFDPFLHDQLHPDGDKFEGFDTVRRYPHTSRVGINLPNPSVSFPFMQGWRPFESVFGEFDSLIEEAQGKFGENTKFKTKLDEYNTVRVEAERKLVSIMEETSPSIKNRIAQLVDSVARIPTFPFQSILPKYIEGGDSGSKYGNQTDLFFLPNKMQIVRAPIAAGLDGNILNAKPNLKKAVNDDDLSVWFKMAPTIQTWLIEPLRKRGWSRP